MVISLALDADLHMSQLMPLPLTVSCSSKIQIDFTFLVLAYPGSPGKEAVKWLLLLLLFILHTKQLTFSSFSRRPTASLSSSSSSDATGISRMQLV